MLLIAVHGPIGAGKTSLLAQLAGWFQAQGRTAEGFLAEAGTRSQAGRGAERYDLRWLRTGALTPFAERDESCRPPYRFAAETLAQAHTWASSLATQGPPPLVILDEFGNVEAVGGGHLAYWPDIAAAQPEIVVIAVREGLADVIEKRLGQKFDVQVEAVQPEAWDQLRAACLAHADWMRIGLYGATAGGVEATLGALLHGSQAPLRGLALSSLQAALLVRAGEQLGLRLRVVWVAFIAAGLKALSPAGSRVRPMLGISLQGVLFGLATRMLGWNSLGLAVGCGLVGVWAAAQGVILQYLLVGNDLLKSYGAVADWAARHLGIGTPALATALGVWIGLWGLTTALCGLLARRRADDLPAWLHALMQRHEAAQTAAPAGQTHQLAWRRGLRDVARPSFWLPLMLMGAVLLLAGSTWEAVLWMMARAAAVGMVLFALVYAFDLRGFLNWLRRRGYWGPALAFARAASRFREK